ncbi:MAG: alpha/beta fold hydrolase [Actinomycetota bacterium]|nr:alpha/beta fold hydrolase [Actinomycetota bacterium]
MGGERATDESSLRLVCFPHAGGSASFFHPMASRLPAAIQPLAVQYPGRQNRRLERPLDNIDELADQAFAALRSLADRPLAFFGHSMGAILAFEVARRLEQDSATTLVRLFASGRRAPSAVREETVHLRDDAGLIGEIEKLSGTDSRLLDDPDVLAMVLPALRADYRAIETYHYRPGPPLSCPISALTGDVDPRVTIDEVQAWSEHTNAEFELTTFPGGHFFLSGQQDAVVATIADSLSATV